MLKQLKRAPCMLCFKVAVYEEYKIFDNGLSVVALLICALLFDFYFLLEIILVIAFIVMTWAAYRLSKNLRKEYKKVIKKPV
jgi:hypothetical protein